MKKGRKISNLYFIASLLNYVVAVIGYISHYDHSSTALWLSLGTAFLACGLLSRKREAQNNTDNE